MDDEVRAVIVALAIIASVFSVTVMFRSEIVDPFIAIGLLDETCRIGYYPSEVVAGSNITLCIFVANHMGYPVYYKVVYKIGAYTTLPTNESPSPEPSLLEWRGVLAHDSNITFLVEVPINLTLKYENVSSVALIFELWSYDIEHNKWVYTGRWVHLYVRPVKPPVVTR